MHELNELNRKYMLIEHGLCCFDIVLTICIQHEFIKLHNIEFNSMMEAFERFKSLSDTEKKQFLELMLKESSWISSGDSVFRENTCCERNSPSKTKQSTLDKWLIRKGSSSSAVNKKASKAVHTSSDVNNDTETQTSRSAVSNTCERVHSSEDGLNSEDTFIKSLKLQESKRRKFKDISITADKSKSNSYDTNDLVAESTYNLRSKRKPSKAENDGNGLKEAKSKTQNTENSSGNFQGKGIKCNCLPTENLPAELTACNISSSESCLAPKLVENRISEDCLRSTNISVNKASSNHRIKKKESENLGNDLESGNNPRDTAEQTFINNVLHISENEVHILQSSHQYDYDAFCKVNEKCSQFGLNILDILLHENVQNLLSDQKFDNDSVVFIGTHKSMSGRLVPVVHAHESKAKLIENLYNIEKSELKQS